MKYHVEKSITIAADLATVKAVLGDFNQWNSWSPWTIVDPEHTQEVAGTPGEPGHTMSWKGEIIGSGKQTLARTDERRLDYDLVFLAPFKSQAATSFLLESTGQETTVTWTLDSRMPIYMFFMTAIMKNWIGMDYERGLKMLKAIIEDGRVDAETTNNGIVDVQGFSYVGIQRTIPYADAKEHMSKDFEQLMRYITEEKGKSAKHWVSIYPKMSMRTMQMTYIAAASDEELQGEQHGPEYVTGEVKPGRALEIKHNGSYDFLGNAWSMGMMYLQAKRMRKKGVPYEYYWNSPRDTEPNNLETSIYFPVK